MSNLTLKDRLILWAVCIYHAALAVLLTIQPSAIMDSDAILQQAAPAADGGANEAMVQFGFEVFRSYDGEYRSILYSSEQEELFGKAFFAARKMAKVGDELAPISWTAPLVALILIAVVGFFVKSSSNWYTKHKAEVCFFVLALYPLLLILSNILAVVAVPVLANSNLCGPNFIELRYDTNLKYGANGTFALIHNGTESSCRITGGTLKAKIIPTAVGVVLL
uniref:Uncharacterized protein n=1 Tax=Grammatophora oceanica TaxID=210454 RepID=A0A7S1UV05_9STRA